ncbi:MAG TPA: universal stress protein [Candidatus Saccharimonadales bacterium]|nr:universal stress protein [Candidatus Saccharimonadales bacterium]
MYSKILVPLDGSKAAEKVLPYARHLAGKFNTAVELLAVIDIAEMASHMAAEKTRHLDTLIEDGVRSSEAYLRKVANSFSGAGIKCTVEKGRAEDVIIERGTADPGTLITMATHGRSGLNRFLLGSIAEKVLRGTANPLLIVRATEEAKAEGDAGFKTVIVPLDGSELAESVLPTVAELAKTLGLEVALFRAYHIPYNAYAGDEGLYAVDYDDLIAGVRDEANEYLEKKVADMKKLGVEKVSGLSKEGFAGDEIIGLGRKTPAGLIAMSSHGRSGVQRLVLGSVTETVVRHTSDPVLVVRAR